MSIQVLPDAIASQIAAGEVIERPSSVVKELIENAIDAGADKITVITKDAGRTLIEISDNGCGISAEELPVAVMRHATSKLRNAEDLFHIRTLGFRGEALAAAGSVSHMSITSKIKDSDNGSQIKIDGGVVISQSTVAANQGTIIRIRDLFFNVPARLKFLKSDRTERSQIETLIARYALAYPFIRWQNVNDDHIGLQTSGNGDYREILASIYGIDIARDLLEVELEEETLRISGFISPVALTRANRKEMNYFINGRWVQDVGLNSATTRAYQTLIMVGRFPIVSLFLTMDPEWVDVNVHPAKAEVRFQNPDKVIGSVHRAVRRGLLAQSPVPELNQPIAWPKNSADQRTSETAMDSSWGFAGQKRDAQTLPLWNTRDSLPTRQEQTYVHQENLASMNPPEESFSQDAQDAQPAMQPLPPSQDAAQSAAPPRTFPILRWIGQIGLAFIIAEGPDGLYLIDQHAAHERILFEKMLDLAGEEGAAQLLLVPESIQLPPWQAALIEENLPILHALGFRLESFGPNAFRIHAIPAVFEKGDPVAALRAVTEELEENEAPLKQKKEDLIAARVCKKMAVKAGQTLSETEQRKLIRELEESRNPRTCPHGRPTMIHLSISILEKQFGRKGAL